MTTTADLRQQVDLLLRRLDELWCVGVFDAEEVQNIITALQAATDRLKNVNQETGKPHNGRSLTAEIGTQ